jgi:thioredoxin 1
MEYKITNANFNEEVLNSELPVLIDFYADWCGPCKMMSPVVEELAGEYEGKAKVAKINVDQEPEIAEKYGVMSIPNFVFIKNGKLVDQQIGATAKAKLVQKLDNLI